jgi:general secretion pathway protein A
MYLNFFNLKREPFNITPDPDLLYLSPSHKEALASIICGVIRRKGFVEITGEVGVGKTTIIRSFLGRIDKQTVKAIYIFNSNISFKALLKTIYQNIGHIPQSDDVSEMVNLLHMILIDEYKAGRNVVLIIDEAQNMPAETLENLRMLSNLETSTDKLIQIVLSGQPEFAVKLNGYELRQLKQRIAIRVKIIPLSRKESLEYINHRLKKSLITDTHPFTSGAMHLIARKSYGIPRIINIYCDNCLVTSFGNQKKKVTYKVAREIIAEQEGERQVWQGWWAIAFVTALVVVVTAGLFYL